MATKFPERNSRKPGGYSGRRNIVFQMHIVRNMCGSSFYFFFLVMLPATIDLFRRGEDENFYCCCFMLEGLEIKSIRRFE